MTLQAFHRPRSDGSDGQLFTVVHAPEGVPRGLVVVVHPFAEEHNKSRRNIASCARALADEGLAVVATDLPGCGDSDGELETVSWSEWVEEVRASVAWGRARFGTLPTWLWGIRAGCLLAAQASDGLDEDLRLVFWQPQLQGRLVLQQFLRLKMAGLLHQGSGRGVTQALQAELDQGRAVDVAGYTLGPALAAGLAAAQCLSPPDRLGVEVLWLEVEPDESGALKPASAAAVELWRAAGFTVREEVVQGPSFWQSAWLEEAPRLVARTAELVSRATCRVAL